MNFGYLSNRPEMRELPKSQNPTSWAHGRLLAAHSAPSQMNMSVPNRTGSLPQQVMHERRVIDDCRVCEASTSSQERCIRFDLSAAL